jgi:plastocyanin
MEVRAKDFAYHPDRLTVPRGRMVDLTMINDGPVAYSLVLKLPAAEVKFSDPVDANGRRTLSFRAPEKPGEYEIYCPIGDHRARGMTATLVVR